MAGLISTPWKRPVPNDKLNDLNPAPAPAPTTEFLQKQAQMINQHRTSTPEWNNFAQRLHNGMGKAAPAVESMGVHGGHLPHLQMGTQRLISQKRRKRMDEMRERDESRIERKRYMGLVRDRAMADAKGLSIVKRDRLMDDLKAWKFTQLRYGESRWAVANHQDMATIWTALDAGSSDPAALGADLTKQDVRAILDSIKVPERA